MKRTLRWWSAAHYPIAKLTPWLYGQAQGAAHAGSEVQPQALTAVSLAGVCAARLLQRCGHPLLHHPHADLPAHGASAPRLQVWCVGVGADRVSAVGVCVSPLCRHRTAVHVPGHHVCVRNVESFHHQKGPRLCKDESETPSSPSPPPVLFVKRQDSSVCPGCCLEAGLSLGWSRALNGHRFSL